MILDDILAAKRSEVEAAETRVSVETLRQRTQYAEARREFLERLRSWCGRRVIAEMKRKSPSCGVIRRDFDAAVHAREYAHAGAACLSVLTDGPYFGGCLDDLLVAREACDLPLLRKDFIVDPYQVVEARAWGADAVLLIVTALGAENLVRLMNMVAEEGLDVLVEVHSHEELDVAVNAGAVLIGINNRDLRTFVTSTRVTRDLVPLVPPDRIIISESGLGTSEELADLERIGVHGFLIGEALMRAPSPGTALASLLEA